MPFGRADVGQPVPREHAFGRHDQIVAIRRDGLEKCLRGRRHIPVKQHLAGRVEDADVHGLSVQIDPAIVTMLAVVESSQLSSCADARVSLR
jgi:hypothetical protein